MDLETTGILKEEFPELSALDVVPGVGSGIHKNNFYHTLQVLQNICEGPLGSSTGLRWAAVLHDIGKPKTAALDQEGHWTFWNHNMVGAVMASQILDRYQVPTEWKDCICSLVQLHMRPVALATEPVTDSAIRRVMTEAGPLLEPLMELAEADITSKNRETYIQNIRRIRKEMKRIQELDYWESLRPVINGTWLMEKYPGIPGSEIGRIKEDLKRALASGVPNTIEALLPYVNITL